MTDDVEALIAVSGGIEFGVNDWGSCQYTGALNLFNALEVLVPKHGRDKAFQMLHLSASHKGVNSVKVALSTFRATMLQQLKGMDYTSDELAAEVKRLNGMKSTVDDMFEFCRSSAWDLWGTAPFIAEAVFKDLKVSAGLAPGQGPCMNVEVQSINYETGLYCWLLWDEKLIKGKPEDVFGGFDT